MGLISSPMSEEIDLLYVASWQVVRTDDGVPPLGLHAQAIVWEDRFRKSIIFYSMRTRSWLERLTNASEIWQGKYTHTYCNIA
jgi:hypothetical protein